MSGFGAANANLTTSTAAAKLTSVVHRGGLSGKGMGFGVGPFDAVDRPGPCPIVDLNQMHLQIAAAPDGGILGSLLCQLTGGPSTTTTTTTTTAAASP